jgi:hypothetical protein
MTDVNQLFADDLIDLIDRTFQNAYVARMSGKSETELIIEHDIEAASENVDDNVQDCARKTIMCAVRAVDNQIGFHTAHERLIDQVKGKVDKIIRGEARKQARRMQQQQQRALD